MSIKTAIKFASTVLLYLAGILLGAYALLWALAGLAWWFEFPWPFEWTW
jgi:hypothetical protein